MRQQTLVISLLATAGAGLVLGWTLSRRRQKHRGLTAHRAEANLKIAELLEGRPSLATGKVENG